MAENTEISWADDTFNPWEGCQKVGPACDGCYAEARNLRYAPKGTVAAPNWGPGAPRRRTSASNWAKPLKWEREQAKLMAAWDLYCDQLDTSWPVQPMSKPAPRFVFCASLADVFDNAVDPSWRRDLFDLIGKTPHLTWLLLTKRPGNIVKLFLETWPVLKDGETSFDEAWPCNAWAGASIPNQKEADSEVPKLLAAKAMLNIPGVFLSMEPLLGPVDLTSLNLGAAGNAHARYNALTGMFDIAGQLHELPRPLPGPMAPLDWVITGGETDQGQHKARITHPAWERAIRDQCAAAGVPYHRKQAGEFISTDEAIRAGIHLAPGSPYVVMGVDGNSYEGARSSDDVFTRVGKKAAGRLLDGVTHDARPTVAA